MDIFDGWTSQVYSQRHEKWNIETWRNDFKLDQQANCSNISPLFAFLVLGFGSNFVFLDQYTRSDSTISHWSHIRKNLLAFLVVQHAKPTQRGMENWRRKPFRLRRSWIISTATGAAMLLASKVVPSCPTLTASVLQSRTALIHRLFHQPKLVPARTPRSGLMVKHS